MSPVAEGPALYVVSLTVAPDAEAEFNHFYHREHIPAVLSAVPALTSVRRYAEYGVDGSLRWYERRYLAIYECSDDADVERFATVGALPAGHPAREAWDAWLEGPVGDVDRRVYRQIYEHPRLSPDGRFGRRPFFLVTADIDEGDEGEFADWYHGQYLPTNVAEVPAWTCVRRYESVGAASRRTFVVYEADSEEGLARALSAMRAGTRVDENLAWHGWDPIIRFQDAATFRPIFRSPD